MKRHKKLEALIRSTLGACDDLRRRPWQGSPDPFAGHCYVASEALYHLLGGLTGPWKPMFLRVGRTPHWFLKNKVTGEILDVTVDQFGKSVLPYRAAIGRGFLTKRPSRRAQDLINRLTLIGQAN